MKRYFSALSPFRKVPDLLKVLSLSKRSSRRSRICPESEDPEPVERAAPHLFLPAGMQKM